MTEETTRVPSLRERILQATTKQELAELLREGDTYQFASRATRNKWERAANKRHGVLNKQEITNEQQVS